MFADISSILALIIGSSSIILGIAFVIKNQSVTEIMEKLGQQNKLNKYITAFELISGIVIVYLHNIWVIGYKGLITVIGWYLIIDSVADLVVPRSLKQKMGDNLQKNEEEANTVNRGLGFILIIIGTYLLYSII